MEEKRIDSLSRRIGVNEKTINRHNILLRGNPADRYDQGIVGVISNIETTLRTAKRWMFAIGTSLLLAAVLSVWNLAFDLYMKINLP